MVVFGCWIGRGGGLGSGGRVVGGGCEAAWREERTCWRTVLFVAEVQKVEGSYT